MVEKKKSSRQARTDGRAAEIFFMARVIMISPRHAANNGVTNSCRRNGCRSYALGAAAIDQVDPPRVDLV